MRFSMIYSPYLMMPIDASQIRRVYENIISNACTHNRPGIQIYLTVVQQSDRNFAPSGIQA